MKLLIQDVQIDNLSYQEFERIFLKKNLDKKGQTIFFANAHCVNLARKDEKYLKQLLLSDFVLPDGVGIEIAAKLKGEQISENLNGTDLIPKFLAENSDLTVYLLGAKADVIKLAKEKIQEMIPNLNILGYHSGYFDKTEEGRIIAEINALSPDVLLVGLGVPKQENWIMKNKTILNAKAFFAVGGYFDFASGKTMRAPKIIRKLKLEWLFRMINEPKRLYSRYIFGNPIFIYYCIKDALNKK